MSKKRACFVLSFFLLVSIPGASGDDLKFQSNSSQIQTNFNFLNVSTFDVGVGAFVLSNPNNKNQFWGGPRKGEILNLYSIDENSTLSILQTLQIPKFANQNNQLLLDVETNKNYLYFSVFYDFPKDLGCANVKVFKSLIEGNSIGSPESIFESKPCINGLTTPSDLSGRMTFNNSGQMFISSGNVLTDISTNIFPRSDLCCLQGTYKTLEKMTNLYGKVTQIDPQTKKFKVISKGHRAPQGLLWDQSLNVLWETEHGPRGGDELNIIKSGKDYGWPFVSYGIPYDPEYLTRKNDLVPLPRYETHEGFEEPTFVWSPSIAPSQLVKINQEDGWGKSWTNSLIVSTLKDNSLHRLKLSSSLRVLNDERIFIGSRIRDIGKGIGIIIISTDDGKVKVIKPSMESPLIGSFSG
jgi:aldose sugar dehydrogenase